MKTTLCIIATLLSLNASARSFCDEVDVVKARSSSYQPTSMSINNSADVIYDKELMKAMEVERAEQMCDLEVSQQRASADLRAKPNVRVGMTAKQVLEGSNWGNPVRVNSLTNRTGTHQQWVYETGYIYVDNGRVTAIQN